MRLTAGIVASALCLFLHASDSHRAAADDEVAFRTSLPASVTELDPVRADGSTDQFVILNVYDQLYEPRYGSGPYSPQGCLAEGPPTLSEDGRTVTIRLKEKVRFADDPCFPGGHGRVVTAADVVFSLKRLMDPRSGTTGSWLLEDHIVGLDAFAKDVKTRPPSTAYPDVEGIRAPDARTVRLKLLRPWPQLAWVLAAAQTSIHPREAVACYAAGFSSHPVGSGPFQVETLTEGEVVLVRNETYREAKLPLVSRAELTYYEDPLDDIAAFESGRLDVTGIPRVAFDRLVDPDTLTLLPALAARGCRLVAQPKFEIIYGAFNMDDPVVGAPAGEKGRALRRAISLATDDDWAVRNLYNGRATVVPCVLLPEFPECDPAFVNPWKRGRDETHEEALARAKALLAEAGIAGGKGVPVLRKDVIDRETSKEFFKVFQKSLADLGLRVEPVLVTWPEFISRRRRREGQMWGVSWGADYPDAQNFLQLFYGPNGSPGPNATNFHDAEFDRLYERASTLGRGPLRTELYRMMQRIVVRECPWNFRYRRINLQLVQPWVRDFRIDDLYPKYLRYVAVDAPTRAKALQK